MTITRFFPLAMLVLSACASVVYAWDGDWRHAAYWAFATGITASVTF